MITLIFGDSIAWGAFDRESGGWAERLRRKGFDDENFVYNCSISGNTSTDILSRIQDEIDYRLDPEDDLKIIFAFGINDSAYKNTQVTSYNTSIQMFQNNVEKMIAIAKKYTDDIYFVGLTSVDEEKSNPVSWAPLSYTNDDIREFNGFLQEIVEREKLVFISAIDLLEKSDLYDGVHPNSKGHQKILDAIFEALNKEESDL